MLAAVTIPLISRSSSKRTVMVTPRPAGKFAGLFHQITLIKCPHPFTPMKILLLVPAVIALFSASCRTTTPLDPNTFQPSTRCLPENVSPHADSGAVDYSK
jgi:hypothetical protein